MYVLCGHCKWYFWRPQGSIAKDVVITEDNTAGVIGPLHSDMLFNNLGPQNCGLSYGHDYVQGV